jgi:hypothetical protein
MVDAPVSTITRSSLARDSPDQRGESGAGSATARAKESRQLSGRLTGWTTTQVGDTGWIPSRMVSCRSTTNTRCKAVTVAADEDWTCWCTSLWLAPRFSFRAEGRVTVREVWSFQESPRSWGIFWPASTATGSRFSAGGSGQVARSV